MIRRFKQILRHWKSLILLFLILIISYQSWKIHYLEKLNVVVYQHSEDDNNTDNSKSEQESSGDDTGDDTSDIVELEMALNNKNQEIEELKQEIEALYKSIEALDKSSEVLSDIFWDIGKYVPKDDTDFFTTPSCDVNVKPNFFLSQRWIFYDRKNGYEVYAYASDVGYVYSTLEVTFNKFKKTKKK